MKTAITALLAVTLAASVVAGDNRHERSRRLGRADYIIERQQAGQVSGPPIGRRIRGSREIDIYKDGSMFEKNNYVGSTK